MPDEIVNQDRESFYRAAVLGLYALDARERTPRRFGPDADARWAQLAGSLGAGDRIDILLRDAGKWGAAFSPAECFGLFGLAEDEPFGPDWPGLPDQAARTILSTIPPRPTVEDVARALGLHVSPVQVPALRPTTKLAVAGGSALVAVALAFAADTSLRWADQVVAVAAKPSFRQLAGLAAVLLDAKAPTMIVRPAQEAAGALRTAGFAHVDVAIVSPDAEPEAADLARSVGSK